jgi:hypothetical protein
MYILQTSNSFFQTKSVPTHPPTLFLSMSSLYFGPVYIWNQMICYLYKYVTLLQYHSKYRMCKNVHDGLKIADYLWSLLKICTSLILYRMYILWPFSTFAFSAYFTTVYCTSRSTSAIRKCSFCESIVLLLTLGIQAFIYLVFRPKKCRKVRALFGPF